ncbi:CBS domain-containing protein [Breoghania sp.]|uniref:CBS domain-containing protein n=1 Tax=Breoghania sp. TaxID=2065378 RepID=UPI0029C812AD|nr:CBS domain-containing protein [Breoghania sp.]
MKISALMVPDPLTVTDQASVEEALEIMKINSIRHLPVVGEQNWLKGFVTLGDLRQALIPSMLGNLTLKDLMIPNPITVDPDDEIEIAAQKIYKHKIGGMPVVRDGRLIGVITATDLLRAFIQMMGMLSASSRIDVRIGTQPKALQKAIDIIESQGGDIINVGMTAQGSAQKTYYFRLTACPTAPIRTALERAGYEVPDAME